jgi:hypothetical protein
MTTLKLDTRNHHAKRDVAAFVLLYPEVIDDMERALAALNASPWQVAYATTGLGAGVNLDFWGLSGCSKTLHDGKFTYKQCTTDKLIGRNAGMEGYSSLTTASGLGMAVYEETCEDMFTHSEVEKIPHLIGAAMAGAVQTCRDRNGLDVAQMSFRKLDGNIIREWTVSFEMRKEYPRGLQDILASLIFLNGILTLAGIDQIKIPATLTKSVGIIHDMRERDMIEVITGPDLTSIVKNCAEIDVRDDYLHLTPRPYVITIDEERLEKEGFIMINPDGRTATPEQLAALKNKKIVLASTSAKPLSTVHYLFLREGLKARGAGAIAAIGLCANNPDKGKIGMQELAERAAQMHGLCHVIITSGSGKFVDKKKILSGFDIAEVIGIDTATRVASPNYDCAANASEDEKKAVVLSILKNLAGIEPAGTPTTFYVVERAGYATNFEQFIHGLPDPTLGRTIFQQIFTGTSDCPISSTQMREAAKQSTELRKAA